jgi:hypothetical protein
MKNIWTNVNGATEEYIDSFEVRFHVSDFGMILNGNTPVYRNVAKELSLQLISCHYGNNASQFGLHPNMLHFIKLLEQNYGKIDTEVPGFYCLLETVVDKKKILYFIAAGNNGQEISTGFYLENIKMLDHPEVQKVMKEIDKELYQLILKAKVSKIA